MKKFIVESLSIHRTVHVVEVEDEKDIELIITNADDNWQEWLGQMKIESVAYTEDAMKRYESKPYFWNGTSFIDENGYIAYRHPDGNTKDYKGPKVK